MTTTIRALRATDRSEWDRLWSSYLEFYETALPRPVYDTYFERLMGDDPQDFQGLIALDGDTPVGLAHYLFHRHGWHVDNVCYLQDLYVDPCTRGRGVGGDLIRAVYAAADAAGAADVYWMTQASNLGARKLYDRIGKLTPFIKYVRK
ncbi:GNAT family N-acetyltransferase [Rhodobacteraceae bacterium CCMM004]|nr:GNAT family N-acetyltransferase [Rhodobacteraceae bacterium CCMM004]